MKKEVHKQQRKEEVCLQPSGKTQKRQTPE